MSVDSDDDSGFGKSLRSVTGAFFLSIASAVAIAIIFAPSVYSGTMSFVEPTVVESYGVWAAKPIRIVWGVVSGVLTYSVCQVATYGIARLASAWIAMRFTAY